MTIISKTAGALSLVPCLKDMHKNGIIYANRFYNQTSSDSFLRNAIGCQKTDKLSSKDTEQKNWLMHNPMFIGAKSSISRLGGYLHGFCETGARYLPNFIAIGVAIGSKHKNLANASAIALAGMEAFNFIKNATNFNEKTDYLK